MISARRHDQQRSVLGYPEVATNVPMDMVKSAPVRHGKERSRNRSYSSGRTRLDRRGEYRLGTGGTIGRGVTRQSAREGFDHKSVRRICVHLIPRADRLGRLSNAVAIAAPAFGRPHESSSRLTNCSPSQSKRIVQHAPFKAKGLRPIPDRWFERTSNKATPNRLAAALSPLWHGQAVVSTTACYSKSEVSDVLGDHMRAGGSFIPVKLFREQFEE